MKYLGKDYALQVESATPGTYNTIKGQQNLAVNRSAQNIDTSTKDDGDYGSSRGGQRSVSIPATLIPDLPDANGYDRLLSLIAAKDPFKIRIINTADSNSVEFECSVTVTDRNSTLDLGGPAGGSVTFVNAAAPVVDTL